MTTDAAAIQAAVKLAIQRAANRLPKRAAVIHVRVTRAERAMINRIAKQGGDTVSSFVRDAALDVARHLIEAEGQEAEA